MVFSLDIQSGISKHKFISAASLMCCFLLLLDEIQFLSKSFPFFHVQVIIVIIISFLSLQLSLSFLFIYSPLFCYPIISLFLGNGQTFLNCYFH